MNRSKPQPAPGSFSLTEWQVRHLFVSFIEAACKAEGVSLKWLSEHWIAKLNKDGRTSYLSSYLFPLNTATSAAIAKDKVAGYRVLEDAGIPAVEHWLVRFPRDVPSAEVAKKMARETPLPLVVKPCDRGSGEDVYKVMTQEALTATLVGMSQRYRTIAASPFEAITDEYRVVVLQSEVMLIFRKVRPGGGEWRHNLQFGAIPELVNDQELHSQLSALALRAAEVIGLQFCAIDIITTSQGMKVMEANAGFSMGKVAGDPAFHPMVAEIYRKAVKACFKT